MEEMNIRKSKQSWNAKHPYILSKGDIEASFKTKEEAEAFKPKMEKYHFDANGQRIISDDDSRNCKMDAFKPNRLRPGIFHDVFSKNMETKLNSTCKQCGDDNDLMVAFTEHGICGKCVKKNHREAMR